MISKRDVTSVYIAHFADEPGIYKIGVSDNVKSRVSGIKHHHRHHCHMVIDHVITVNDWNLARNMERQLHEHYAEQQYPRGNEYEWFTLSDDDIQFIKSICVEQFSIRIRHSELDDETEIAQPEAELAPVKQTVQSKYPDLRERRKNNQPSTRYATRLFTETHKSKFQWRTGSVTEDEFARLTSHETEREG